MLTFKEFLSESPEYIPGNWSGDSDMHKLGNSWTSKLPKLKTIKGYDYYIDRENLEAFVVKDNKIVFYLIMGEFEITYLDKVGLQTNMVKVLDGYHKEGLATNMYEILIEKYNIIVSGNEQFDGARMLWKKLGHKYPNTYTYDETSDSLTPINNFDSDKLWSSNSDKRYLVLVVSKNKL